MTTKNYWDLSEADRAALSYEEVERFADYELMSQGVLRAGPLQLEVPPTVAEPKFSFYRIYTNSWQALDVAFASAEAAQAFKDSRPLTVRSEWNGSVHSQVVSPIPATAEIRLERILTEGEELDTRADAARAKQIQEQNEKAKREHAEAVKAEADALVAMWSDWRACGRKAGECKHIVDTYKEYIELANDAPTATKFLLKVFSREQIAAAAAWLNVSIPLPAEPVSEAFVTPTTNGVPNDLTPPPTL